MKCPRCGTSVMSYYNYCWRCGLNLKQPYKSLEAQIIELWRSRGMKVLEESVKHLNNDRFEWTIIARRAKRKLEGSGDEMAKKAEGIHGE